jgi:hypothetical protein
MRTIAAIFIVLGVMGFGRAGDHRGSQKPGTAA